MFTGKRYRTVRRIPARVRERAAIPIAYGGEPTNGLFVSPGIETRFFLDRRIIP